MPKAFFLECVYYVFNYKLMFRHNILYPQGTRQDYTLCVWPLPLYTENGLSIPLKGKHKRGFKMSPLRPTDLDRSFSLFWSIQNIFVANFFKEISGVSRQWKYNIILQIFCSCDSNWIFFYYLDYDNRQNYIQHNYYFESSCDNKFL